MTWGGIVAGVVGAGASMISANKGAKAQQNASSKNDALAQQQFEEDKRRYDLNREDQERWGMMTIQGEEEFDRRNRADTAKYDTLNRTDKERAYQRVRGDNLGAMNRGEAAGNQLSYLMGLGPKRMTGGKAAVAAQAATAATGGTFDGATYLAQNPDVAADSYYGQNPEAHYNNVGKVEGRARPVVAGTGTPGSAAVAAQEAVAGVEGDNSDYGRLNQRYKDFNFNFEADPGYQFRQEQGQSGVNNKLAASGNLLSGAAMKALTRFNQDYASNEYGNSYSRARGGYENDRQSYYGANSDEYNRLGGIQGAGQNAVNSVAGVSGTVQGSAHTASGGNTGGAAAGLAGASAQFAKSSDNYYNNLMSNNNASANAQSAYNNAYGKTLNSSLGDMAGAWNSYQKKQNNGWTNSGDFWSKGDTTYRNSGGYDYLDF